MIRPALTALHLVARNRRGAPCAAAPGSLGHLAARLLSIMNGLPAGALTVALETAALPGAVAPPQLLPRDD